MRVHYRHIILLSLTLLVLLSGCKPEPKAVSTITPEKTRTYTPEPTSTSTATPTLTSTPEYYSQEERNADGNIWTAEEYYLVGYSLDGTVNECPLLPKEIAKEMNTSLFHLPMQGGDLVFNHEVFIRISQNIWTRESSEIDDINNSGVHTKSELEISADAITVTTELISADKAVVTCTNIYKIQTFIETQTPASTEIQSTVPEKIITPGFYSQEEITAQNINWEADYYKTLEIRGLINVDNSDIGICRYQAENTDEFSKIFDFSLPNPGEVLIIDNERYTRTSPNVWMYEYISADGFHYSKTFEIFENLIIETHHFESSTGEITTCVNRYIPQSE